MSEKILIIAENKSFISEKVSKLKVFRRCDAISCVPINNFKELFFDDIQLVIVNSDDYNNEELTKLLEFIKRKSLYTQVIFYSKKIDHDSVFEFYNKGLYCFLMEDMSFEEIELNILNCLKYLKLIYLNEILKVFVSVANSGNAKNNLYTHKALKEAFDYLIEYKFFKNSVYVVLTIDESSKTKVSMNRLAKILKRDLRDTDVIAQGLGKFYLLLPHTDLNDAKIVIKRISDLMGEEHNLRSGICKVDLQGFEKIEKNAVDSLKSAIINDELFVSLNENYCVCENWVDTSNKEKHFKLFNIAYEKKLKTVIEPLFFRFANEFSSKFPDVMVCQYANDIECLFSLKKSRYHSELVLRYDGFTKLNAKITNKGLDTAEDSTFDLLINKLDDKYLSKILNKLYNDFITVCSED